MNSFCHPGFHPACVSASPSGVKPSQHQGSVVKHLIQDIGSLAQAFGNNLDPPQQSLAPHHLGWEVLCLPGTKTPLCLAMLGRGALCGHKADLPEYVNTQKTFERDQNSIGGSTLRCYVLITDIYNVDSTIHCKYQIGDNKNHLVGQLARDKS